MNDWNIQTRAHQCQACGKGFEDKSNYHTLLFDDPREGYVRRDICSDCWKSEFAEGDDKDGGFVSYWQGTYEAPPPTPPEPIQKENAESLLRKLIELNRASFSAAGYILAVMLERKRQLRIKEQFTREGQRVFVYEQPKSGDIFTIADPALQLNQLESVQTQVADLLEFGLNENGEINYPPEPDPNLATPLVPSDNEPNTDSAWETETDSELVMPGGPAEAMLNQEESEKVSDAHDESDEDTDDEDEFDDDEEDDDEEFDDDDDDDDLEDEEEDEIMASDEDSVSENHPEPGEPLIPR